MNNVVLTPIPLNDLCDLIAERVRNEIANFTTAETPDQLLTFDAAAEMLNVSKVTLTEWRKMGLVPYQKIGKRVYFKKSDLLAAGTVKFKRRGLSV